MKFTSSLITLITVIIFLTILAGEKRSQTEARKSRCSPVRDREMDVCASKMGFLGDHSFKVPNNSSSMESFCRELKGSIGCLQSYSRECLQGFTRQLLTSSLKRGKQQYALLCQDEESRKEFMSRMACLTDDKIGQFHRCMDASIARFEFIESKSVPSDNRLPSLCCSYQIFNRDVDSTLDKICGRPAQRKGSVHDYVKKIVSGTAGEFFGLICDGHRSMEECKSSGKTKSTLARLEEVTHKVHQDKLHPKSKSLIPVLLDILDSTSSS